MLLTFTIIAVFRIANSSPSIRDAVDDNDGLFHELDRELDDFLEKALDDLPQKLDDFVLQTLEGSGEWSPGNDTDDFILTDVDKDIENVVTTAEPTNGTLSPGQNASLNSTEASLLLQMLSSMALAQLPIQPGTSEVVARLVSDVVNEEVAEMLANSTSTTTTATLGADSSTSPVQRTESLTTTTPTQSTADQMDKRESSKSCHNATVCYDDSECGQGQCHGVSLGKCNCHACLANLACDDDKDCGGLRKSCKNGSCQCAEALSRHGFPLFIVALTEFCSQRTCTVASDSCFGLPCNHGFCSCK